MNDQYPTWTARLSCIDLSELLRLDPEHLEKHLDEYGSQIEISKGIQVLKSFMGDKPQDDRIVLGAEHAKFLAKALTRLVTTLERLFVVRKGTRIRTKLLGLTPVDTMGYPNYGAFIVWRDHLENWCEDGSGATLDQLHKWKCAMGNPKRLAKCIDWVLRRNETHPSDLEELPFAQCAIAYMWTHIDFDEVLRLSHEFGLQLIVNDAIARTVAYLAENPDEIQDCEKAAWDRIYCPDHLKRKAS